MEITGIELSNVRGFKELRKLGLSKGINILIGPNNTGKSTILNSIFQLQRQTFNSNDITIGGREFAWFKNVAGNLIGLITSF